MLSVSSVYDCFESLSAFGPLEGKFLLAGALSTAESHLVLAAGIAGAASLAVESDPARVREANRQHVVEFTVTTLSEAIRILKNQLRKRESVSICLTADAEAVFREAVERGLQPDLVYAGTSRESEQRISTFLARGAIAVSAPPVGPKRGWVDAVWTVDRDAAAALPAIDRTLEGLLGEDFRVHWVRTSPLYLDRLLRRQRFLRLRTSDAEAFTAAVARACPSSRLQITSIGEAAASAPDK